jgi:hypothetical protein
MRLLKLRFHKEQSIVEEDFFEQEAFRDCFAESDLKELDGFVKQDERSGKKRYMDEYTGHVRAVVKKRAAAKKAAAAASGAKSAKALSGKRKLLDGKRLPYISKETNVLSLDDATAFMPPGGNIFKSRWDNRWKATYAMLGGGCSRSYALYGEVKAYAKVAHWCWDEHELHTGEACPHEWIAAEPWQIGA